MACFDACFNIGVTGSGRLDREQALASLFDLAFPAVDGAHIWQDLDAGREPLIDQPDRQRLGGWRIRTGGHDDQEITLHASLIRHLP
jgi:hypothetical protein